MSTRVAERAPLPSVRSLDTPSRASRDAGLRIYIRALYYDKVALAATLFLIVVVFAAILAPLVTPFTPTDQSLFLRNSAPLTAAEDGGSFPHLLGTDALGRDLLSRLIYGARVSLSVGALGVIVSGTFGVLLGMVSGYYGGRVDDVIMRAVDVQMGFPSLLLALIVLYALGPSIVNVIFVLAITAWTIYARVARGITLSQRENVFVEAALAIGCTDRRILFVHLLPNMLSPLLVLGTLQTASLILSEASLSFLGLGIQPPDSSWGLMLVEGRQYIRSAWWLVTFPGLAIFFTALSLNLLASWFRNVTDPVQRWRFLNPQRSK